MKKTGGVETHPTPNTIHDELNQFLSVKKHRFSAVYTGWGLVIDTRGEFSSQKWMLLHAFKGTV
jgi:hypothetical protein